MLGRLKDVLWIPHPDPEIEAGERVVLEGRVALNAGLFAGRTGSLTLTDRRIICNEKARNWPFKPTYWEVSLSDVSFS
jgi:hypothetical protein